jgi:hypothetical protein
MKIYLFKDGVSEDKLNWFKMDETELVYTEEKEFLGDSPTEIRLTKKGNYVIDDVLYKYNGIISDEIKNWRIIPKEEVDVILKQTKEREDLINSLEV